MPYRDRPYAGYELRLTGTHADPGRITLPDPLPEEENGAPYHSTFSFFVDTHIPLPVMDATPASTYPEESKVYLRLSKELTKLERGDIIYFVIYPEGEYEEPRWVAETRGSSVVTRLSYRTDSVIIETYYYLHSLKDTDNTFVICLTKDQNLVRTSNRNLSTVIQKSEIHIIEERESGYFDSRRSGPYETSYFILENSFSSSPRPIDINNWIRNTENIFNALKETNLTTNSPVQTIFSDSITPKQYKGEYRSEFVIKKEERVFSYKNDKVILPEVTIFDPPRWFLTNNYISYNETEYVDGDLVLCTLPARSSIDIIRLAFGSHTEQFDTPLQFRSRFALSSIDLLIQENPWSFHLITDTFNWRYHRNSISFQSISTFGQLPRFELCTFDSLNPFIVTRKRTDIPINTHKFKINSLSNNNFAFTQTLDLTNKIHISLYNQTQRGQLGSYLPSLSGLEFKAPEKLALQRRSTELHDNFLLLFLNQTGHGTRLLFNGYPVAGFHVESDNGVSYTIDKEGYIASPDGLNVPLAYDCAWINIEGTGISVTTSEGFSFNQFMHPSNSTLLWEGDVYEDEELNVPNIQDDTRTPEYYDNYVGGANFYRIRTKYIGLNSLGVIGNRQTGPSSYDLSKPFYWYFYDTSRITVSGIPSTCKGVMVGESEQWKDETDILSIYTNQIGVNNGVPHYSPVQVDFNQPEHVASHLINILRHYAYEEGVLYGFQHNTHDPIVPARVAYAFSNQQITTDDEEHPFDLEHYYRNRLAVSSFPSPFTIKEYETPIYDIDYDNSINYKYLKFTRQDLVDYSHLSFLNSTGFVHIAPSSVTTESVRPLRIPDNGTLLTFNSVGSVISRIHPSTKRHATKKVINPYRFTTIVLSFERGIKYEYLGNIINNCKVDRLHYEGAYPGYVTVDWNTTDTTVNQNTGVFAFTYYEYDLSYFYNKIETTDELVTVSLLKVTYTLSINPLDNWNQRLTQLPVIEVLQVTTLTPIP